MTESLADLMERMISADRKSLEALIADIFLASQTSPALSKLIRTAETLSCETQRRIEFGGSLGYLDISLIADNRVVLVIENKIASGYTQHSVAPDCNEERQDEVVVTQLEFYEKWLSANHPGAALVLLTHLTDPPANFSSQNEQASAVLRSVCKWSLAHKWFANWALDRELSKSQQQSSLVELTREFCHFLEEHNMSKSELKSDDVDLLTSYFSQDIWKKVADLMQSARNIVLPLLRNPYGKPRSAPEPKAWEETQILWDWALCHEKELQRYIGWGLSGKHGLRHLGIEFDEPMQAFMLISSEGSGPDISLTDGQVQECTALDWSFPQGTSRTCILKKVPAGSLLKTGEFNRAFEHWILTAGREAAAILQNAKGSVKS